MPVTVRVPIHVPDRGRVQTVLLVSSDADWRSAAERALGAEGYRVIAARHAGQALVESTRFGSVDLVVAEGEFGRGGLSSRIFEDHPHAKSLHLPRRPRTREELLESISTALK